MNSKILIIKFSAIGDLVLATPALRAIKEKFRDSHIAVLVNKESEGILFRCPYVDELLMYDYKDKDKGVYGFLKLANVLKHKEFDLVIDLQNNRKSHLLAFLSASPERYGYDNAKYGFLLNRRIKDRKPLVDPVSHQFQMLSMLGINFEDSHLELWPSEDDQLYIDSFLNSNGLGNSQKLVGINIAASQRWEVKNWPLHHIARVCEELSSSGIRVVITGMEKDLEIARKLMDATSVAKPIIACGKTTVNQLACLIKRCSVYISPDSAPLHIAASQDTPFVALFGPTNSSRHLPPAKDYIVIQKYLPCSPCYSSKCNTRRCMELITPEDVLEAISRLLK